MENKVKNKTLKFGKSSVELIVTTSKHYWNNQLNRIKYWRAYIHPSSHCKNDKPFEQALTLEELGEYLTNCEDKYKLNAYPRLTKNKNNRYNHKLIDNEVIIYDQDNKHICTFDLNGKCINYTEFKNMTKQKIRNRICKLRYRYFVICEDGTLELNPLYSH